ncbi:MAG: 50S ribosomal protein L23 [Candidatus Omnitrophica bacterium]|nr:50S ribosomal protein L23 [Candidatus Omnitrophota bacterium]
MEKSIYSIVKAPLITEKSTKLQKFGKYVFLVDKFANKIQIRNAIEKLYNVKIKSVHTLIKKGKTKRVRFKAGKTVSFKKAIVTLKEGEIKFS